MGIFASAVHRFIRPATGLSVLGIAVALTGCGGGSSSTPPPPPQVTVTLSSTTVVVPQDGTQVTLPVTITPLVSTVSVTVTGLPAGMTQQFSTTTSGSIGNVTFAGSAAAAAGSYPAVVTVTENGQTATANFTLVSAVVATVGKTTDTT